MSGETRRSRIPFPANGGGSVVVRLDDLVIIMILTLLVRPKNAFRATATSVPEV